MLRTKYTNKRKCIVEVRETRGRNGRERKRERGEKVEDRVLKSVKRERKKERERERGKRLEERETLFSQRCITF